MNYLSYIKTFSKKDSTKHASISVYYFFVIFYFIHAIIRIVMGFKFYPAVGSLFFLNILVAILGLYGYSQKRNEEWVLKMAVFILPISMFGLIADLQSSPIWISSFYIAFTCGHFKVIKYIINTICMLPVLLIVIVALIFPVIFLLGFGMALGANHEESKIYSPTGRYVAIIGVRDLGATGGSVIVSAGRHLNLGILGRYLPDRAIFYGGWSDDTKVEFIEEQNKVLIDGESYYMQ